MQPGWHADKCGREGCHYALADLFLDSSLSPALAAQWTRLVDEFTFVYCMYLGVLLSSGE